MLKLEAVAEWSAELLSELRTWEASQSWKEGVKGGGMAGNWTG